MRNIIIISDTKWRDTMELIVSTMKMLIISSNLKIAFLHYENWSDYIQLSNTRKNSGSQFVRPVGNIIRFQFSALLVLLLNTHVVISCTLLKNRCALKSCLDRTLCSDP